MTNHADLIAALRIPMNVNLPGAPELDVYDEQRKTAADRIEELEADLDNLSDKIELERALTDGAHRRAGKAEAKLAKAVDGLTQIERTYYQEAANPSPETIRRMSARMNGIARDTQDAIAEINGGGDTCNS